MSTKACIARPHGASWQGYYVHTDGNPEYTGRVVIDIGRSHGIYGLWELAATAPQGWTRFPDEPSIYHDEPFIVSPVQDAGIEWLYLLQASGDVAVYRANGWADPDLRRFTHLATIDPARADALVRMVALTDSEAGINPIRAGLEEDTNSSATSGAEWPDVLASLGKQRLPAVAIPSAGVTMTPDELVRALICPHRGTHAPHTILSAEPTSWRERLTPGGGE